ncbi:MAG TPA: hypothetical protein VM290_09515 [Gaiellaceae bacterium]|nr:hypothetical protein [Gaiellaceae bacterium]
MRITKSSVQRTCAICERSLLMGERATRFSPHGNDDFVDVCPLCHETAIGHGWVKEGSPTTPTLAAERRRRRAPGLMRFLGTRSAQQPEPVMPEPILRRLSESELAMVEAAEVFNASDYRRTVGGIAKSLGTPRASVVPLSGSSGELVVTVAWDISWYQYRVNPESVQPVRLAERGHDPGELEGAFTRWNAHVAEDGRVVPDIERG